jgi:hypothetical protein
MFFVPLLFDLKTFVVMFCFSFVVSFFSKDIYTIDFLFNIGGKVEFVGVELFFTLVCYLLIKFLFFFLIFNFFLRYGSLDVLVFIHVNFKLF